MRYAPFVLAVLFAAPLAAQGGQVEVWIPLTTRAAVVDALTQRLTREHWMAGPVSDAGARFDRSITSADPLGRPSNGLTLDRLTVVFHDLPDTLRVSARIATVTNPSTASERIVVRDDASALQELGELLSSAKSASQNRRPSAQVAADAESVRSAEVTPPRTRPLPAEPVPRPASAAGTGARTLPEEFGSVEYQGGMTGYKPPHRGWLVLTDSALEYHECWTYECQKSKNQAYQPSAAIVMPYRKMTDVGGATERHGASVGSRIALGAFASERRDELVTIAFDAESAAEAPVFKTKEHESAQLIAKIRFHLRKMGLLPANPTKVDSVKP
jgi:hypothetical protein